MLYKDPEQLAYPKDATITDVLLYSNLNSTPPDKPAIIDGTTDEVIFTYASFRTSVRKIARHLRHELGIGPGTVVGILSTNTNYYPVCVHAVLAVGAVLSALNPVYEPKELAHALRLSSPKHILVEGALVSRLVAALDELPELSERPRLHIWDTDQIPSESPGRPLRIEYIIHHGNAAFEPERLPPGAAANHLAFICFSSGTSGLVKGVPLTHGNVVSNIYQHSQRLRGMFTPTTVTSLVVPFFHILGLGGFSCQYVIQGVPIVVFKRFEMRSLLQAVRRHRVTHINVVPPIALEFLRNPIASEGDYTSVQCLMNAAAPLSQQQAAEISKRLGCAVTQWYGMTEASPAIASQREDEVHMLGSIGKLVPGLEMRILGEDGNGGAAPGTRACLMLASYAPANVAEIDARLGEFAIRGPNVMRNYVHGALAPALEDPRTPDGFLKTGDIGYVNDDGYIFIVDRAKEMIKVKGHQVAPAELEALLIAHPLVNDAAVCGVYDESGSSEIPVAYITTSVHGEHGLERLKEDVLRHVHGQIARYKQIKGGVNVLDRIPRNASGKILRRLLPAKLAAAGNSHPNNGGSFLAKL